jgi:hypothetical protein
MACVSPPLLDKYTQIVLIVQLHLVTLTNSELSTLLRTRQDDDRGDSL